MPSCDGGAGRNANTVRRRYFTTFIMSVTVNCYVHVIRTFETRYVSIRNIKYMFKEAQKNIWVNYPERNGHAVEQLVKALRYKPEGRGFDSRWCHLNSSLTSFRPHYGPRFDSASNRNEYQDISGG